MEGEAQEFGGSRNPSPSTDPPRFLLHPPDFWRAKEWPYRDAMYFLTKPSLGLRPFQSLGTAFSSPVWRLII